MKSSTAKFCLEGARTVLSSRAEQDRLLCGRSYAAKGPCVSILNRSFQTLLRVICALGVLCGPVLSFALDREAFTITNYNLNLQIEPEQHRLGVRGKITLRNDSSTPQKVAVLQISSSLDWRQIKVGDQAVQFLTQPYTSDIDHTGALSEAIVTLPQEIAPHATIDLDIAYEGVIVLDATRLTRIGTPEDAAASTDWDQIDEKFIGVRGAGYVAWYPIATESASLSEENELPETLARWRTRHSDSQMALRFESTKDCKILFSGSKDSFVVTPEKPVKIAAFSMVRLNGSVPTFVLADYRTIESKGDSTVNFLAGKEDIAASYAAILGTLDPLPAVKAPVTLQVAELPQPDMVPFVSANLALMPLQSLTDERRLTLVYALARQRAPSPRPWISEGLSHFAQAVDVEQQRGRRAALDYLTAHAALLVDSEEKALPPDAASKTPEPNAGASHSLINTTDEIYLQSKAMCVWWMLRDMLGDAALQKAIAAYKPEQDKDPSYMPRLISAQTQRDLEWFFDDWVYRDPGLPDFKVESAFARQTTTDSYMLTVTVDNLGTAGAEVPVIIKLAKGDVTKRIEVRARSKATIRVETPAAPQGIRVNDGSVPESDLTNNEFKVTLPEPAK